MYLAIFSMVTFEVEKKLPSTSQPPKHCTAKPDIAKFSVYFVCETSTGHQKHRLSLDDPE